MSLGELAKSLMGTIPLYKEVDETLKAAEPKENTAKRISGYFSTLLKLLQDYLKDGPSAELGEALFQTAEQFNSEYPTLSREVGSGGFTLYGNGNGLKYTIEKYLEPLKDAYAQVRSQSLKIRDAFVDQLKQKMGAMAAYLNAK